ncbi:probable G-protein coupled receptor Mth-like 5 [Macrosteles quadrilineatus]|uniref:probable G-protein coupled receptor Mth-like 5 n=1 Tax=Macrosteles quadrilineatus TaxID=74068 RepID=UPI0023E18EEC|nr:probable G-protein coupled receptor Mth-like 5 [Macrosteles quadrilineatus]
MLWRVWLCVSVWSCVCTANIPPPPKESLVEVNKCCERQELMVDGRCTRVEETNVTAWSPVFSDDRGQDNVQVKGFTLLIGVPKCYSRQQFPIYHIPGEADRLALLPNGHLRHYYLQNQHDRAGAGELWEREISQEQRYYDYPQGFYCLDKVLQEEDQVPKLFAIVCDPHVPSAWHDTDFLLRRIIDPLCHGVSLACYVTVAVVHFVLPQLRDLVGNMVTTLCVCLAVTQVADTVRIFTEFTSPKVYLIADAVLYASLLGAFFWLNSAGYYIWKTFRSRNVFLRITDGRKYCYYSLYVWTSTIGMTVFAIFAHLTLDDPNVPLESQDKNISNPHGAIGWLGVAVFFTPIACTILVDLFFYISTVNIIKRMSTYGRIHHKMKYSFVTFGKLLLTLSLGWVFLLLAWTPQSHLYYAYICSNAVQGPLVLYICVCGQKRVRFLLRKACCYEKCFCVWCRPRDNEVPEWGEECMAMNTR